MRVGIVQSNYIPWRGYFDIIDDVDLFIFFDDVQYTKRDWRNRNKIKAPSGTIWLTVPVLFRQSERTLIQEVKIDYSSNWIKKHMNSLTHLYGKAPHYKIYAEEFFDFLNRQYQTISELNVNVCRWVMNKLDIKTETRMSSEFSAVGAKTERIIDILRKVRATSYLSGPAAKSYIEIEKFREAGFGLEYKVYEYPEYPQLFSPFEGHVSILDLLFNCGPDSRLHLKSRRSNEVILS